MHSRRNVQFSCELRGELDPQGFYCFEGDVKCRYFVAANDHKTHTMRYLILCFLAASISFSANAQEKTVYNVNGGWAYLGPSQATSWTRWLCPGDKVTLTQQSQEDAPLTYYLTTDGDWVSNVVLGNESAGLPSDFDCAAAQAYAAEVLARVEPNDKVPAPVTITSRSAECAALSGARQTDCFCRLADMYEKKYVNEDFNSATNLKAYQRALEKCMAGE